MSRTAILFVVLMTMVSIGQVDGCVEILYGLAVSLREHLQSWMSTKDDQNWACPPQSASCGRDQEGYRSMARILKNMDGDRDGEIVFAEGLINITQLVLRELNTKGRDMNMLLSPYSTSMTYADVWEKWANSSVYSWNTAQFSLWISQQINTNVYDKRIKEAGLNGRTMVRLAEDEKFLRERMGIINNGHLVILNNNAINLLKFGNKIESHQCQQHYMKMISSASIFVVSVIFASHILYSIISAKDNTEIKNNRVEDISRTFYKL